MRARYINISIHEDLAKKIDEYIKNSKLGYRSRAEIVAEALRLLIVNKKKWLYFLIKSFVSFYFRLTFWSLNNHLIVYFVKILEFFFSFMIVPYMQYFHNK